MTIYLFNFNNYYNRIVKRYTTLDEYNANGNNLAGITGVNFNPNDGIYTKQVVNYNGEAMPDYLLVVDEYNQILSRWYIIESRRTRGGQFEVELYRDVIAEWYDDIVNAPCFIEKATVGMYDTAIFNNEDMTFNQIKTKETLIKDKAGCGWYVGYAAKNTPATTITIPAKDLNIEETEYATFTDYPYYKYTSQTEILENPRLPSYAIYYTGNIPYYNTEYYAYGWDEYGNPKYPLAPATSNIKPDQTEFSGQVKYVASAQNVTYGYRWNVGSIARNVAEKYENIIKSSNINWEEGSDTYLNMSYPGLYGEFGKIYKINGDYYRIVKKIKYSSQRRRALINDTSGYGRKFKTINDNNTSTSDYVYNAMVGHIEATYDIYQLAFEPVEVANASVELFGSEYTNKIYSDEPYKIFAIPYSDIKVYNDSLILPCGSDIAKTLVNQIIITLGDNLYDIQLLPYAPIDDFHFLENGNVDWKSFSKTVLNNYDSRVGVYTNPNVANSLISFIIYPYKSEIIKNINKHSIPNATTPIEQKIYNCCDKYRLVSPNYNGQFEFSAAKNYGVTSWNVVQSCKPYQPYIRVSPDFDGLYGGDFKDARGLICGGDFSISQYESAWRNYQIQNKNYQVMFDRQIQNMEVNNSVQRTQDIFAAIAGTAQGGSSGALAGFASGMPYGAISGAIIGGITAAAAGIADVSLSEKLRKEALDFTKDQFGYSLQNIKALPYSLTKVGTQNADFKLFPFLEYFTCTEIEKQALENKLKYNGMTVMRIGQINDFIQPQRSYIKAKLIRLEAVEDDYHVLNAISKELNEGVYI